MVENEKVRFNSTQFILSVLFCVVFKLLRLM